MARDLYSRLDPTLKKALKENRKKYKHSCDNVITVLKGKDYFSELTIEELKALCTWTETSGFKIDWQFGEGLFKEHKDCNILR